VTTVLAAVPVGTARSPFAGADVCHEAGLPLPEGARRPLFDNDCWDLTEVTGLPVSLALQRRRFDFTQITDTRWRLVAKELVIALLAPHHEAVAALPRAYRTPHHVSTCNGRLAELIRFLRWLTDRRVHSLADLTCEDCEAYHEHRRYQRDDDGVMAGELSSGTRRLAALIVTDLLNYRDLFTADRVPAGLRPWAGTAPSAVAGDTGHSGGPNKTLPSPTRSSGPRSLPPCTWCASSAPTPQGSPGMSGRQTGDGPPGPAGSGRQRSPRSATSSACSASTSAPDGPCPS
jgi:hypothetical protein